MQIRSSRSSSSAADRSALARSSAFARITSHPSTAWVVLLVSLLLSVVAWWSAEQFITRQAYARFQVASREAETLFRHHLRYEQSLLRGAGALLASYKPESEADWRRYWQAVTLTKVDSSIETLYYVHVLPANELAAHQQQRRKQGAPQYRVWPEGIRPEYSTVLRSAPEDTAALGYDMLTHPQLQNAMMTARASGQPVVSGPVDWQKDGGRWLFMFHPVYRAGWPTATSEQRHSALSGFVVASIQAKELIPPLRAVMAPSLEFQIYQGGEAKRGALVLESPSELRTGINHRFDASHFKTQLSFPEGGQGWTLALQALRPFLSLQEQLLPWLVTLACLLADLVLFIYMRSMAQSQRRVHALAVRMNSDLMASEQMFRTLVESAPDAVVVIDDRGIVCACNPATERFFGYSAAELIGKNIKMLVPEPHKSAHDGYLQRYLEGNPARIIGTGREVTAQRKDGSLMTVHLNVGEQCLKDGGRRFIGFMHNLTERTQAETAVKERQALLQAVIETSVDGFWITDLTGRFLEVNDVYCRWSGYSRDELLQLRIQDLEVHDPLSTELNPLTHVIAEGGGLYETQHRRKDGQLWPVEISATSSTSRGGRLIMFCRDLTQRKHYENMLQEHRQSLEDMVAQRTADLQAEEELTRLILDSTAEGIYGMDLEGRFTFVNPSACRLLGYEAEQLIGQMVHTLIHHSRADGSPYPIQDCVVRQALLSGKAVREDNDYYWCADGQLLPVAMAGQPLFKHNKIVGAVVSFTDIRQRLVAEEALHRHAQELRQQNEILEQFNRITVGRELDMIRLKQQVNVLTQRLGEPPPYNLALLDTPPGDAS